MIINGRRWKLPSEDTCPTDAAEKKAWEFFREQIFNSLQITIDLCQSKSNFFVAYFECDKKYFLNLTYLFSA